jgi:acetate kinase
MSDLIELKTRDARAAEAVALFCYQAKKRIGSFAAALRRLDTLLVRTDEELKIARSVLRSVGGLINARGD